MTSMMIKGLVLASAMAMSGTAHAAALYDVAGTAQPWMATAGGLNSAYTFGFQDGTAPTVASFASAGITPGGSWAIVYASGVTSAFGDPPVVNNNGYVGSLFKDDDPGSSGNYFPSHYLPGDWSSDPGSGVFLNALIATFTDDTGAIVGSPFSVGAVFGDAINGYHFVTGIGGSATPAGATRIQLGLNDDAYTDNLGNLRICVGADFDSCSALMNSPGGVPEPATWAMMLAGFGMIGAALRRRPRIAGTRVRYA